MWSSSGGLWTLHEALTVGRSRGSLSEQVLFIDIFIFKSIVILITLVSYTV